MSLPVLFKLLHILSVIVAVGANATYQFWYSRAGRDRDRLLWVMDSVRALDRRVANPAYLLVFLSGVGTVLTTGFSFEAFWISASIVLYVVVALMGLLLYAPAVRRQKALALADPTTPEYDAAARRARAVGATALLLVALIVVMMVTKPML